MNVKKIMATSRHIAVKRHTFTYPISGAFFASNDRAAAANMRELGTRLAISKSRTRRQASLKMGPIKKAKEVAMERANAPPGL
jgi:hypothetical protein